MTLSAPPESQVSGDVRSHRAAFTALGIALIFLGAFAFVATVLFTVAAVVVLGCLLLLAGLVQIVQAARGRQHGNAGLMVLAGIVYLIAGALLLFNPLAGALTITIILAAFLIVAGIVRLVHAFSSRTYGKWGWWAAAGVLDVVLGLLIWAQWPVSGLWVLGLFVGIDMIFEGVAYITVANSDRAVITNRGDRQRASIS